RRQSRADARHRTRMRVHLRVPGWALVADLGGVPVGATAVDDRVHELGDTGNERPHAAQWRPRRAAGHGGAVVREWHGVHRARDRAVQLTIRDAPSLRPEARRWVVANAGGRTWRGKGARDRSARVTFVASPAG